MKKRKKQFAISEDGIVMKIISIIMGILVIGLVLGDLKSCDRRDRVPEGIDEPIYKS